MKYDREKKIKEKYAKVLDAVGKANPQGEDKHPADMGVALIMMQQDLANETTTLAGVPKDFDWGQFLADITWMRE